MKKFLCLHCKRITKWRKIGFGHRRMPGLIISGGLYVCNKCH